MSDLKGWVLVICAICVLYTASSVVSWAVTSPTVEALAVEEPICVGVDRHTELLTERAMQWRLAEEVCAVRGGDACVVAGMAKTAVFELLEQVVWNAECVNKEPEALCAVGRGSCDGQGVCEVEE